MHNINYVQRNSRYRRRKKYMKKNGFRRSDSKRGYWRNGNAPLGQSYVKKRFGSRFRSQSGGIRSHNGIEDLVDSSQSLRKDQRVS